VDYFGDKDIRKIDDEALEKYKAHRLKTVTIATVNRELSKARKMFDVALSKKWVFDNPFKTEAGKQLIQVAAEKGAVEQVLSDGEERRLFLQKAAEQPQSLSSLCWHPFRNQLRPDNDARMSILLKTSFSSFANTPKRGRQSVSRPASKTIGSSQSTSYQRCF